MFVFNDVDRFIRETNLIYDKNEFYKSTTTNLKLDYNINRNKEEHLKYLSIYT